METFTLVLPGTYQEYEQWHRMVYRRTGPWLPPRPVLSVENLWGVGAEEVGAFHQIGTFWNNLVWGSEPYQRLMSQGLVIGKAWAMDWDEDWQRAARRRDPLPRERIAAARVGLLRLQRELAADEF